MSTTVVQDVLDTPQASKAVVRGSATRTVGYIASSAANALVLPFLFRYLGVVRAGEYVTVLSISTILGGIVETGLTGVSLRMYSTAPREARPQLMRDLLTMRLSLLLLASGLVMGFVIAVGYPPLVVGGVALCAVGAMFENVGSTYNTWLATNLRLGWLTISNVVRQFIAAGLVLVLLGLRAPLVWFFVILIPAGLAQALISAFVARPHTPLGASRNIRNVITMARGSGAYVLAMALGFIYPRVPLVLTSIILPGRPTGLFGAAFRLIETLTLMTGFVLTAVVPLLTRAAETDRARLVLGLRRVVEISLIIGFGLSVVVATGAHVAINILAGPAFHQSIALLEGLALILALRFLSTAWGFGLLSTGKYSRVLAANALSCVCSVAVGAVLIPAIGTRGAVISALTGELCLVVAYGVSLRRELGTLPFPGKTATTVICAAALCAGVIPLPIMPLAKAVLAPLLFMVLLLVGQAYPPELRQFLRGRPDALKTPPGNRRAMSNSARPGLPERRPRLPAEPRRRWHASVCVMVSMVGLVAIAITFALARMGHRSTPVELLFWAGFIVFATPFVVGLLDRRTTRSERLLLVLAFGLLSYGIKVLHDPLMFAMPDEFTHLTAAEQVVSSGSLFHLSSLRGGNVTSSYPGLEALTTALSETSGLSLFVSGLIVISIARAMMMVALFVVAEHMSRSARIAGLSALLFAANANFFFWSAQFSYESLSFPLLVVAVAVLLKRAETVLPRSWSVAPRHEVSTQRLPLTLTTLMLGIALIATHHLTSYAFVGVLWAFTLLSLRPKWRAHRAIGLAMTLSIAAAAWFFLVAPDTRSYLGYVLHRTVKGAVGLLSRGGARAPFQSATTSLATPLLERGVSLLALLLVAVTVLSVIYRRQHFTTLRSAAGMLAMLSTLGFLALTPLRASAGGWETANRGQELFFPAVALILALAATRLTPPRNRLRGLLVGGGLVLITAGGLISGWPFPQRLPQPLEVQASDGRTLIPQGLAASRWAVRRLGRSATYSADTASGRELAIAGARLVYLEPGDGVPQLLHDTVFEPWLKAFLIRERIDYVFVDRRQISTDDLSSYYFPPASDPGSGEGFYPQGATDKFASIGASAVLSSGDLTVFDVSGLYRPAPRCAAIGFASLTGVTCRSDGALAIFAGADRIVALPHSSVRLLSVSSERVRRGISIVVRLQFQNPTQSSLLAGAGLGAVELALGSARTVRTPRGSLERDNLGMSGVTVPPNANVEASVTFVIHDARLIADAARGDGSVFVSAPSQQPRTRRPSHADEAAFQIGHVTP